MFGISKINPSATLDEQKQFRLHYCGTCKSIAKLHGHTSRVFTNYDTVFLGEILSGLTQQKDWLKHFTINRCMTIPKKEQIPLHLKYTANISVLLADLKVEDNITDSKFNFTLWKLLKAFFSKDFSSAQKQLVQMGVPTSQIWSLFKKQIDREQCIKKPNSTSTGLDFFSESTAEITGLVFKYGAHYIRRDECANTMYEIGFQFGELAYLLDALEDFEKDKKTNTFNAIQIVYNTNNLTDSLRKKVIEKIKKCTLHIKEHMLDLPIKNIFSELLALRLSENIGLRINNTGNTPSCSNSQIKNVNWKVKAKKALEYSRNFSHIKFQNDSAFNTLRLYVSRPLLFLFYILIPYRFWAQSNAAGSDGCGACIAGIVIFAICGSICRKPAIVESRDCCGNRTISKGNTRCNC